AGAGPGLERECEPAQLPGADDLGMAVVEGEGLALLGDATPRLRLVMGADQSAEGEVRQALLQGAGLEGDVAVGIGEQNLGEAPQALEALAPDHRAGEGHAEDDAFLADVVGGLPGMNQRIAAAGQVALVDLDPAVLDAPAVGKVQPDAG